MMENLMCSGGKIVQDLLEALHRSKNTQKSIFYANLIIENWKDKGVRTYKDVIRLDHEFSHWNS